MAGTVALLLDADPSLTVEQVRQILRDTAQDWGPSGQDVDYGWGRLDAYAAVRRAGNFTVNAPPPVPGHLYFEGAISSSGQQGTHTVIVADTSVPLAATLVMPDWVNSSNPDFELYIYNPDGSEFGRSTSTSRQEQVSKSPTQLGIYTVIVKSYSGSGSYFVDVSGGLTVPDHPPSVAVAVPAEGGVVSGRLAVKVVASDDRAVSKTELGVDGGPFADITSTFDATYYTYYWDTTTLINGPHRLTARATDNAGQVTASDRTVTVENRPPPSTPQFRLVRTGTVRAAARDSTHSITVLSPGYVDLRLGWATAADLDFYVYSPDGTLISRAYTLNNPEQLRVDTVKWGIGQYTVRVSLFSGPDTVFTLTAEGYRVAAFAGTVAPSSPNFIQTIGVGYTGRSLVLLSWQGTADLDFYVHDPPGRLRTQAYTVNNPEQAAVVMDTVGTWSVRVNLFAGPTTEFILSVWVPDTVLT